MAFSLHSATSIQKLFVSSDHLCPPRDSKLYVSHIYSHVLRGTCTGGKFKLAVHNASAAVTSSGKEQKMGKCTDGQPALPNPERSQEMHDSWQLYAGMGGGTCTEATLNHQYCLDKMALGGPRFMPTQTWRVILALGLKVEKTNLGSSVGYIRH